MGPKRSPDQPHECGDQERHDRGARQHRQRPTEAQDKTPPDSWSAPRLAQQQDQQHRPEGLHPVAQKLSLQEDQRAIENVHRPRRQADTLPEEPPAQQVRQGAGTRTDNDLHDLGRDNRRAAEHIGDRQEKRVEKRLPEEAFVQAVAMSEVLGDRVTRLGVDNGGQERRERGTLPQIDAPDHQSRQEHPPGQQPVSTVEKKLSRPFGRQGAIRCRQGGGSPRSGGRGIVLLGSHLSVMLLRWTTSSWDFSPRALAISEVLSPLIFSIWREE